MKVHNVPYQMPETMKECFDTSCLLCYYYIVDRSKCEEFYREKLESCNYGSVVE